MIRRSAVLVAAVALGLLSMPFIGVAQQPRTVSRIGWLAPGPPLPGGPYQQFLERAKELGYVEGKNLVVEFRGFQSVEEGKPVVSQLVRSKVDLIVAQAPNALLVARTATQSIPIVAFYIGNPVRMGVVDSLARPGGNITGFTWDTGPEWAGKSLQLVKEILPRATRIAILWNRDNDSHPFYLEAFEAYAKVLGLSTLSLGVRGSAELEGAFRKMMHEQVSAVVIFSDPFTVRNLDVLTTLLNRFPIPAMWGTAVWPLAGALVTFGPNVTDHPGRAAEYMDKIFKGSSPADLPFQQPTRFDLIVNVTVAKALGLRVPPSVLLQADRVIDQ